MKILTITDDQGTGRTLLCERHFKKIQRHIEGASRQGVLIDAETVKRRGCRLCSSEKIGFSPWSGTMFKIWRGFRKSERR